MREFAGNYATGYLRSGKASVNDDLKSGELLVTDYE
jgi:hypothetical protein